MHVSTNEGNTWNEVQLPTITEDRVSYDDINLDYLNIIHVYNYVGIYRKSKLFSLMYGFSHCIVFTLFQVYL